MMDQFVKEDRFFLIAGPCALESEKNVMYLAEEISNICRKLQIEYCFKVSWDKANRTSAAKYRGPGITEGVRILKKARQELGVRVATDIHEPWQAEIIAEAADVIQIPAFLCRQTDLIKAAAETGKIINIKKAQFLSPEEMGNVIHKFEDCGNRNLMLCERGSSFGYNHLVVDMTGLVRMKRFGYPVVFDATHSVQISGGGADHGNSGKREYVPYLARAAMATGAADGIFMEVHDDPDRAKCDGSCMLHLNMLEGMLKQLIDLREIQNKYGYGVR
ncbi:3-deoxy-8-phosphooctulonate synthase [Otoolea muris]|uniref:3-deoxy-8-phosphooctulonate synthase n=1 Tax=Otoolea muris TaxID=2941515 RepID=UPI003A7F31DB